MRQQKNKIAGVSPPRRPKDPIRAAADYGIDIPMLTSNLARTPPSVSGNIRLRLICLMRFAGQSVYEKRPPLEAIKKMQNKRRKIWAALCKMVHNGTSIEKAVKILQT